MGTVVHPVVVSSGGAWLARSLRAFQLFGDLIRGGVRRRRVARQGSATGG